MRSKLDTGCSSCPHHRLAFIQSFHCHIMGGGAPTHCVQVTEVKKIKPNTENFEKAENEFGEESRFSQAGERDKCFFFPSCFSDMLLG